MTQLVQCVRRKMGKGKIISMPITKRTAALTPKERIAMWELKTEHPECFEFVCLSQ